ncbi:AAEL006398-PA [Aedes aegypti]|uniref:AAEL006398-PA n=1 Tax=Aedes aegypti TaxID=7159 RepID=Q176E3_AEDAE|nr:AAEL006398-PA [Aedes aegypti]
MSVLICLFITAIAATASAVYYPPLTPSNVEESNFAYQLKSFRQQLDECAEYLQISAGSVENLVAYNYVTDDPSLKCLIRCAGINGGWWSVGGNNSGLQAPVIESYFAPGCDDTCYVKRTQDCISANVVPCQDDCSKAYQTFLCYYHQYGNLKSSEEYIPLPPLDAVQAAVDCMLILRIPKELLEQYAQGVFPEVPETQCLYRCQYLAEGIYDGVTFNLTRDYIREYTVPSPQIKDPATQACVDNALASSSCNECARFWAGLACFRDYGVPNRSVGSFQVAAGLVLGQRTCLDEDLNPRYNAEGPAPPAPTSAPTSASTPAPTPAPTPAGCMYNCGS